MPANETPDVLGSAALALSKAAIEIVLAPAIVAEAKALAPIPVLYANKLAVLALSKAAIEIVLAPAIVAEAKALAPIPVLYANKLAVLALS